jgi:hypothetical protein
MCGFDENIFQNEKMRYQTEKEMVSENENENKKEIEKEMLSENENENEKDSRYSVFTSVTIH